MPTLINPQEIEQRKSRANTQILDEENKPVEAENLSGMVKVDFETMGRFSMPESLYFEDWDTTDINDLTLCNEENIFETIVAILNKNAKDKNYKVEDMLLEEFLEVMIGIKKCFDTHIHQHKWVCNCQSVLDEKDIQLNDYEINLNDINYVSILEAEEKLKEYYRENFNAMSREAFVKIMYMKYGEAFRDKINSYGIEDEVQTLKIQEPIHQLIDGKRYSFRFMRVGDLILANREASKKFSQKMKLMNVKKYRKEMGSIVDFKAQQEEQVKKFKEERAKEIISYAQSAMLIEVDGKQLNTMQEKVEEYKKIKRGHILNFIEFLSMLRFGISNEMNLVCPLCGQEEKRFFRKEFNPLEFIPIHTDTTTKLRINPTGIIYM